MARGAHHLKDLHPHDEHGQDGGQGRREPLGQGEAGPPPLPQVVHKVSLQVESRTCAAHFRAGHLRFLKKFYTMKIATFCIFY